MCPNIWIMALEGAVGLQLCLNIYVTFIHSRYIYAFHGICKPTYTWWHTQ